MLSSNFDSKARGRDHKFKKLKKSLTSDFFSYILNKTTTFFPTKMNHKTKEAFLDVLLYLFEYYSDEHEKKQNNELQIRNELVIAGFQEEMIEHAMDWVSIFNQPTNTIDIQQPKKLSVRVLNDKEKALLDEECQNYIARLEKFGLLSPLKRELLIDKLMAIGFEPLDIEVVKALSILMLFQEPGIDIKFHTLEANAFWDKPLKLN